MRRTIEMSAAVGSLYLSEEDGKIVRISKVAEPVNESSAVLEECQRQLSEYFEGKRTEFDFPMQLSGTAFQCAVWNAMRKIEYGTCVSYQKLAEMAGYPKALRAVGTACGHNPIGIVIPCHRVIRSDGSIGNYAWGVEMKSFLQQLEKEKGEIEK